MYKLKHKRDIPAQITEISETGEAQIVNRDTLLEKFKSELLVFYKGVTFQNKVPVVKMYPGCWEVVE